MVDPVPMVRQRQRPSPRKPAKARALDLGVAEGTIEVTRGIYCRGAVVREDAVPVERIHVPVFHTDPARVDVEGSVTRNLGDYNSARVAVRISMPCYPEETEVRRVYDMISGWLDEMVPAELDKALGTDEGQTNNG